MSSVGAAIRHAAMKAKDAAALAKAEAEAHASGKEPFSLAPLRALYSEASLAKRAEALRFMYYLHERDVRTMAELVEVLKLMEIYQ